MSQTTRGAVRHQLERAAGELTTTLLMRAQHIADTGVTDDPDDALSAKNWAAAARDAGLLFQALGRTDGRR